MFRFFGTDVSNWHFQQFNHTLTESVQGVLGHLTKKKPKGCLSLNLSRFFLQTLASWTFNILRQYQFFRLGGYIYLEASLHISGQKARLVSGPMAGTQCMSFKYHMMGRGIGSLKINQMNEGTLLAKMVWSRVADQGDDWMETRFNLFGTIYTVGWYQNIMNENGPQRGWRFQPGAHWYTHNGNFAYKVTMCNN